MSKLDNKNPYYIIAPRYIRTSGGTRVLYRLADLINKAGASAFIYLWPYYNHDYSSSPMDIAPFLTQKTVDYHFKNGLTPIVIYPETVKASKFNPPFRVRYLLNYDDLLFKNEPLENDDYLLSFSHAINKKVTINKPKKTLFLPVSDTVFFSPPIKETKREGAVYYAGKFKYLFKGKTLPITETLKEITRDRPDSQSPEEIRDYFRKCEYFYCYEDSALALEAILCGCPTVFLPNEHFKNPLGAKELNGLGFAWGNSPDQLKHAKDTVEKARSVHLSRLNEIQYLIKEFIDETQVLVKERKYETPFAEGFFHSPGRLQLLQDSIKLVFDLSKDRGFLNTLKIIWKRVLARRTTI
jgi:Zn-finger protein